MDFYLILTYLITISACFAYLNQKYLKLPFVIGLFFMSTLLSLGVLSLKFWSNISLDNIKLQIELLAIDKIILKILLGFLLFAGALHTNWESLKKQIRQISIFALAGVIVSMLIIAGLTYITSQAIGITLNFTFCLIFGALISPTDPIAVLGILTKADVPKKTEYTIVGESLFNDGVGVVLFVALLGVLETNTFSPFTFSLLFLQEAVGGMLLGLVLGYSLHILLRSINHYESEVLLTLAFVMGGYSFCNWLHTSGALAMVVMGLMVGNFKKDLAMSDITQEYVGKFWELIDVILNAILFIIIAFVLIIIDLDYKTVLLALVSIFIVLFARFTIVYLPHIIAPNLLKMTNKEAFIISWGGLRGGLSLALVLSLPNSPSKDVLIVCTYFCVLFSIIIQGLSIERLAKSK